MGIPGPCISAYCRNLHKIYKVFLYATKKFCRNPHFLLKFTTIACIILLSSHKE